MKELGPAHPPDPPRRPGGGRPASSTRHSPGAPPRPHPRQARARAPRRGKRVDKSGVAWPGSMSLLPSARGPPPPFFHQKAPPTELHFTRSTPKSSKSCQKKGSNTGTYRAFFVVKPEAFFFAPGPPRGGPPRRGGVAGAGPRRRCGGGPRAAPAPARLIPSGYAPGSLPDTPPGGAGRAALRARAPGRTAGRRSTYTHAL